MYVDLLPAVETESFEFGDDLLAGLEPIEPAERLGRVLTHRCLVRHYVEHGQATSPTHLKVVHVVRGRDLHQPCAERWIHQLIRNDRNGPTGQGQFDLRPNQTGVTFVLGAHRHTGVAEHGLWPSRRHGEVPPPVSKSADGFRTGFVCCRLGDRRVFRGLVPRRRSKRVPQVVEPTLDLLALRLFIRQRRQATGAPVDDVLPPVDQVFFVEAHEYLADRPAESFVEGKAGTIEVAARPDHLELLQDPASRPIHVLPNPLDEGFPAQIVARRPLLCQPSFDDVLSRDPRVVGPRHPE